MRLTPPRLSVRGDLQLFPDIQTSNEHYVLGRREKWECLPDHHLNHYYLWASIDVNTQDQPPLMTVTISTRPVHEYQTTSAWKSSAPTHVLKSESPLSPEADHSWLSSSPQCGGLGNKRGWGSPQAFPISKIWHQNFLNASDNKFQPKIFLPSFPFRPIRGAQKPFRDFVSNGGFVLCLHGFRSFDGLVVLSVLIHLSQVSRNKYLALLFVPDRKS
jgi:hypothetical protein